MNRTWPDFELNKQMDPDFYKIKGRKVKSRCQSGSNQKSDPDLDSEDSVPGRI